MIYLPQNINYNPYPPIFSYTEGYICGTFAVFALFALVAWQLTTSLSFSLFTLSQPPSPNSHPFHNPSPCHRSKCVVLGFSALVDSVEPSCYPGEEHAYRRPISGASLRHDFLPANERPT